MTFEIMVLAWPWPWLWPCLPLPLPQALPFSYWLVSSFGRKYFQLTNVCWFCTYFDRRKHQLPKPGAISGVRADCPLWRADEMWMIWYRNTYFINILHEVTNQHTHAQNIIIFYMHCIYTTVCVCVCVHITYCTIIIQVTSIGIHNSDFLASNLIYLWLHFIVCPLFFLSTTTLQTTANYW